MQQASNGLMFEVHSAEGLAQTYGTPLYVYEERPIRDAYQRISQSFEYEPTEIKYALMANDRKPILETLSTLGAGAQVNSLKELTEALKAGFSQEQITLTTTNLSREHIRDVAAQGIYPFIDSLEEVEKYCDVVEQLGITDQGIGLRLLLPTTSLPETSTNQPSQTQNRVGLNREQALRAIRSVEHRAVRVTGFHGYLASNISMVEPFVMNAERLIRMASLVPDIEIVNVGGGFAIPNKPSDRLFDFERMGRQLSERLSRLSTCLQRTIRLILEPGRSLVGSSGTFLTRVTNIKQLEDWVSVGVDASFGTFPRPRIYGSETGGYHHVVHAQRPLEQSRQIYTIAGASVLQDDFLAKDRELPLLKEGDLLAFGNAGAYSAVLASGFPGQERAEEVFIHENGDIEEL